MLMNESTKPNIAIGQERAEGGMRGEEKEKKKEVTCCLPLCLQQIKWKITYMGIFTMDIWA